MRALLFSLALFPAVSAWATEHQASCSGGTITFVIDDATGNVTDVVAVTLARPITISIFNDLDEVKTSLTIPPNSTRSQSIPNGQRVQSIFQDITRADGSVKTVRSFVHLVTC